MKWPSTVRPSKDLIIVLGFKEASLSDTTADSKDLLSGIAGNGAMAQSGDLGGAYSDRLRVAQAN